MTPQTTPGPMIQVMDALRHQTSNLAGGASEQAGRVRCRRCTASNTAGCNATPTPARPTDAIRWDSDHVVIFNDALRNVFLENQRGNAWERVAFATDYFDASINRIAAYAIGPRATRKAILYALLDATTELQKLEAAGNNAGRLALMEDMKTLPFGAVRDEACDQAGMPRDRQWMNDVMK